MGLLLKTTVRTVLALVLVTMATCFMLNLLPGSPGAAVLGTSATPAQIEAFNEAHGFNDPPLTRYVDWLGDIAHGDLQQSAQTNQPIVEVLRERLPVTLEIALLSEMLALVIAVPLGLWAAYSAGGRADRLISGSAFALLAVVPFVLALLLVFALAINLGWFPVTGWVDLTDNPFENLRHVALPVLTLAAAEAAVYQRIVRSDAMTTMSEEFVLAARAKGMPTRRILVGEVLRPSSLSLVSLAGVNLGRLIGGTVIVEKVFALPGLGSAAVQGIIGNDLYLVQGIVLVVAAAYVLLNTAVDVGYHFLDPRNSAGLDVTASPDVVRPLAPLANMEIGEQFAPVPPSPLPRPRLRSALVSASWLLVAGAEFGVRRALELPGWLSVVLAIGVAAAVVRAIAAGGRTAFGPRWNATFWLSIFWLVLVGGSAVFAGVLPLADPAKADFSNIDQRPQFGVPEFLGTDDLGRSILSRTVYGAWITLAASFGAVVIGVLVGVTAGLVAGFLRGTFDNVTSLLGDVMLSFPPLILLMGMVTVMPRNVVTIAIGLGVLAIPAFFRVTRASTMSLAEREFVVAARALGSTKRRIACRELLPNVLTPVLAYVFVVLALVVVAEGSLSYLGVGIQPPTPTWGRMIADGQAEFASAPHKVLVPSVVMFVTLYALNTVGEHVRTAHSAESVL